jgi:chromosome segregation ATPase
VQQNNIGSKMVSQETCEEDHIAAGVGNKRTHEEQSINNICIQTVDSHDDLLIEEDEQRPPSSEPIAEIDTDAQNQNNEAPAIDIIPVSAESQMVNELRQALLELRVYICKLRGINRHLQREIDVVKEENLSLTNTVDRLEEGRTTLREENEHLRKELELLKAGNVDTTMPLNDSTFSSIGDDVFEFDEGLHANDFNPHPVTNNTEFRHVPTSPQGRDHSNYVEDEEEAIDRLGSDDSDDVQDKEENFKLINKPGTPNLYNPDKSNVTHSIKSRDTLCDIDELRVTTTNDDEDAEDVILRMKEELCKDQCEELQTDLKKIAHAFWEQCEELKECQSRILELQTENDELECLKWVEAEVDAIWAHVKKEDKANSDRLAKLESSLLVERDELRASVVDKSNEIAALKAQLRNSPCPKMVCLKDLESLLDDLKASIVEKSNEIAKLRAQLRNAPCPEWVKGRIDIIQKHVTFLLAEREELIASVADKSNEIAELRSKLRNSPCRTCVQSRMDNIQEDLKQMTLEQPRHCWWK